MAPKRRFADQTEAEIARRFLEGENQVALAEAYGCSRQLVIDALRRQGVDYTTTKNPPRSTRRIEVEEETQAAVCAEYRAGAGVDSVAKVHAITPNLVYRILREAEATGQRDRDPRCKFTVEQEAEMATLYAEGASLAAVAKRFNARHETVWSILKRNGMNLRPPGGKFRAFTDDEVAAIVTAWEEGESQQAIGDRLGIGQSMVSRLLRIRGKTGDERRATGARHGHWTGGRIMDHGYVSIRVELDDPMAVMRNSGGYVMEHRLVMARYLGRPLLPTETVHHVSGDTLDNRIGNLQLRQGKHGKGAAFRCLDCGSANVEAVTLG